MSKRYQIYAGRVWFTHGAQKYVGLPPYALRLNGRWYRTKGRDRLSGVERTFFNSLPLLDFGLRRCLDYLNRSGKKFSDLPIFTLENTNDHRTSSSTA